MVGWKGTIRSVSAVLRAAERDAQRRQKAALKAQIVEDSATAVIDWETYINEITSVHADLAGAIDWQAISAKPRPVEPQLLTAHQRRAKAALAAFKPRFFDIFHGGAVKRRRRLESNFSEADAHDRADHVKTLTAYRFALEEWDTDTALARRLLASETAAIEEVINEMLSLSDYRLIGPSVSFSVDDGFVHAKPEVHTDEIVPDYRCKQLASGKLSETKMPVGQFNELYQDYVGSVALNIAGDLFHILPIDEVYVTCLTRMLNPQTGHHELTPILSVQFVRTTFFSLNLANIDPSDSMTNFNHTMSFKKTRGFAPIAPLKPIDK